MKKLGLLIAAVLVAAIGYAQDEEFKPHGAVTGEFFGDFYYVGKAEDGGSRSGSFNSIEEGKIGFNLRRFNLGYEHKFSKKISGKLLVEGSDGVVVNDSKRGVYVKYAYLKMKDVYPGADLVIGAQSTPTWSPFSEKAWSYRSVEKTIMDFRKAGSSNELGVSLQGKLADGGIVGYTVMLANGRAQSVNKDINPKILGSVNVKLLDEKLWLEVYGDYQAIDDTAKGDPTISTIKGFVGYKSKAFSAGVEPFMQKHASDSTSEEKDVTGVSFWVRGQIVEDKLNAFARMDVYDPGKDSKYKENFYLIGLDYLPVKNVHIMPNLWINAYNKQGSLGEQDADVVARITFRYKFK